MEWMIQHHALEQLKEQHSRHATEQLDISIYASSTQRNVRVVRSSVTDIVNALSEVFLFLVDAVRICAAETRSDLIHQRQELA
jgi:hypothetical protein